MKGGELHPARNPWVGAGIDKAFRDSERTLAGDVAKRCVANPCRIVRVHVGACPVRGYAKEGDAEHVRFTGVAA
jgi:hypothetical protein